MGKIIAITNNKGGVGKTTTAVNFGAALRRKGFDVLLIDYDGQTNLTDILGVVPEAHATTYDAMKTPSTYITPVRVLSPEDGCGVLDVLPSCEDLAACEVELSQEPDRVTRFGGIVEGYATKYDVVIIDTPPTLGLLTISALYACDEAIIPIQAEPLAIRGLLSLNKAIQGVNTNRKPSVKSSVLFTQFDSRKGLNRLISEQVTGAGFKVFATRIRDNVALAEATAANLDIFRYNRRSNGAQDYDALTDEYLNGAKVKHVNHRYK